MGRLREIPRTAAFAWSTDIARPRLATGTRAGAVDADFSDETKLELWDLDLSNVKAGLELQPKASIVTSSRFYDLAWSEPNSDHEQGIIAGGLESGSLDLWDVSKLEASSEDALISSTTKHTGAIKALQFNPHRSELLATSGNKGELFITDLNNAGNPFRLGGSGRADDFDTLDWNKKVAHIMVTGGSGGFVTVWDVKAKKESLTLNNYGRKPVSAVAWNPDIPTKLATAIPSDQDPLILMWDLRNSSAPEKILRGHEQGVLSLSWCSQDNDLLISCGKDNRNLFWNANTAELVGEFPIVTNWTFQTRWNPRHPNLLATASFDGKIGVSTIQNTRTQVDDKSTSATQVADGEDFFAKAQSQPQESTFTLSKPPKWLKRPLGASFGFGGKIVSFMPQEQSSTNSKISISTYTGDDQVSSFITDFQAALKENDFSALCEAKIENAQSKENKNDWTVIKSLLSDSPRKGLLSYLGYGKAAESGLGAVDELSDAKIDSSTLHVDGKDNSTKDSNRLSAFFDEGADGQNFLADLAASKGARTNNPFHIFSGSESDADKQVTKALMLGNFEDALDICLKENRMSDAFMIAICGGQKCIDKAQAAYFGQQANGPNYLRLLASVVGKNLWDVVYNADVDNWSEVMATLCTYADETEFPDLCEALGDRLDEAQKSRNDASFCYLAGSKLEKVVPIWLEEMRTAETTRINTAEDESAFSVHVQSLQTFIEKVSIFRSVTKYVDRDGQTKTSDWRLEPLYSQYLEYADIVATYGYLDLADQFLTYLPPQYPAAEVARNRIRQASKKAVPTRVQQQQQQQRQPSPAIFTGVPTQGIGATSSPIGATATGAYAPNSSNKYSAAGYQPTGYQAQSNTSYTPAGFGSAYTPPAQNLNAPPPTTQTGPPPSSGPPPSKATMNGSNWNDLPESFAPKIPSRRGTPSIAPQTSNYAPYNAPFPPSQNAYASQKSAALPPPPKAGMSSPPPPSTSHFNPPSLLNDQIQRPPSAAANSYAPLQNSAPSLAPQNMPIRSSSPYNPPPSGTALPSRYTPVPASGAGPQSMAGPPVSAARQVAPNPYMTQPNMGSFQPPPQQQQQPQPPRQAAAPPPPMGPPRSGPPQQGPPAPQTSGSRPGTAQSGRTSTPGTARYPTGDRSHIPPESQPIYDILHAEMQRIKARAPVNFKAQVEDTEKRVNLLFDLLNNDELKAENVAQLKELAAAMQSRNFDDAVAIHTDLMKVLESAGPWMVGVKRLISMSRATPVT